VTFKARINLEMQADCAYNAGMKSKQVTASIQYTIRSIPDEVDRELRRRAQAERKSLNALVLELLEQSVRPPSTPVVHHDLDFLFGTWVEDPAFDEAVAEFERIEEEYWK
jgi:hypothetical protein